MKHRIWRKLDMTLGEFIAMWATMMAIGIVLAIAATSNPSY